MKKNIIKNLENLEKFSKKFLETLSEKEQNLSEQNLATTVQLSGDLGSGKTTFVQSIGKILKIKEKINSPTFAISKTYNIPKNNFTKKKNLIHIDAYRLEGFRNLKNIGLDDQLKDSENLIFIEWPEVIDSELNLHTNKEAIKIKFKYLSPEHREISL
jgi:tRNA threonylcarbamoyladenosine biosynthesis protein TsaE